MQIVTLGPKGTFSEEAALIYQKRVTGKVDPAKIKFHNIFDCLQEVESYRADRAVLPAENMVDGIIGITFDALIDFHDFIKVNDEVHVSIEYVLAGKMKSPAKWRRSFRILPPSISAPIPWTTCFPRSCRYLSPPLRKQR